MSDAAHAGSPGQRFARVVGVWRENGVRQGSISQYLYWVQRFERECRHRGLDVIPQLTLAAATTFARCYARRRRIPFRHALCGARSALRAWSWGLSALGVDVPAWRTEAAVPPRLPPLLQEFVDYRLRHRGIALASAMRDVESISALRLFLQQRQRSLQRMRLQDIDAFVVCQRKRFAPKTISRVCCSVRAFLRFLHATGRVPTDLAPSVAAPLIRLYMQPPRSLPWADVRRILRAIDRTTRTGRRDYALLLLMASYGMGAGEAVRLQLDDIDWQAQHFRVVRPKTGVLIDLPLLPPVANALISYLRNGRPRHTSSRHLFVRMRAPHGPLSGSSPVRHILAYHARAAHVLAPFLGSHALRHSHAGRQVDLGVTPKVLSDILGHRRPESTSAYVRVAVTRLRGMALGIPR